MYTKFQERGKTTIAEIDLSNGKILRTHQIPDFVFVEKISVEDDYIYFLYKDNAAMEYKKLYRTRFES
jgi:glutamine cyclotransferase